MEKRKICFAVSSITNNGVTRVLSILLDEIDYSAYDVSVLLTKRVSRSRTLNENARIIEGQPVNGRGVTGKIQTICSIRKILQSEKFDIIIALGNYAAMYTLLGGIGVKSWKIISERNDPNREPDKAVFRKLRDLVYRSADVMVCQTHDASEYYKKIVKKRVVIFNPIKSDIPLCSGKFDHRIVNFCRIDSQKNLPMLFDAFSEFHKTHGDYRLEVYGNGPLKDSMQKYLDDRQLSSFVRLLDFCPDIHDKIADASMFVSTSDFEGMSNSMIEAMAMGLPVICTDCPIGGAHEVIQNGHNGILVPCGDRKRLVEAMSMVADDRGYAEKLSKNAVLIRKTLDKNAICAKWWSLISE